MAEVNLELDPEGTEKQKETSQILMNMVKKFLFQLININQWVLWYMEILHLWMSPGKPL
ncbi:hypothetical protein [Candidatus Contubernalis alkaliaceticus]|uniref:hypothetical protein n=1 Tax=Candidatus Contubernalis alkaliaceticus TaxID=338645 RepID=UPI001F4C477E|nr:hypothetical protein [Candidatus Contubernalis alkalaceticus]UNC91634.1 hypothetical protein HUE98_05735 [Candidatus Contubernalis alkalaceticus]